MPKEVPEERLMNAGSTSARRVLVVDDNIDSAVSLSILLTMYGHEVQTAHDGHAAFALAKNFTPEVVVLDIGLPGIDGLEVARRIRTELRLADALLVAMTGYGQDEDRARSQEAGFNAHLIKPVDSQSIQALIEHFRFKRPLSQPDKLTSAEEP